MEATLIPSPQTAVNSQPLSLTPGPAVRAIVTCEGDARLAADLLGMPLTELWSAVLDDEADIAPLVRKRMLLQMMEVWTSAKDALLSGMDEMSPYEVAKTYETITESIVELMAASAPPQPSVPQSPTLNAQFNFGANSDATQSLTSKLGVPNTPEEREAEREAIRSALVESKVLDTDGS